MTKQSGTQPFTPTRLEQQALCYIIAEAGSNHDGRLEQALSLIDIAADAGADAVKFQLFRAAKLYPRSAGQSDYLQNKQSIFDTIRAAELPHLWLPQLQERCLSRRVDFLASAFDEESVDVLDPFVSVHKCASYELTHHPLLTHIAKKRKPMIISTGASSLSEVAQAVELVEAAGNHRLFLLQCTASYPTPLLHANVRAMQTLQATFGYPVGLSDHTREPSIAPCASVALGARIIEKHFTLSNHLPGPDHRSALQPHELREMIGSIRATEVALGDGCKEPSEIEIELRSFARRSIFTTRSIKAGEAFSDSNIAVLRNGKLSPGLAPTAYTALIGRTCKRALSAESPVTEDDLYA